MIRNSIGTLKFLGRKILSPFRSKVVVLMYHRVCEVSSDPWNLCVSPEHFAEQIESLVHKYPVISLSDLVRALKEGRLPRRAAVITFDDGYADNFWNAKPVLEKYNVPATVFVTTGYIGKDGEFWWDELESLILLTAELPLCIKVSIRGRDYQWMLEEVGSTSSIFSKNAPQNNGLTIDKENLRFIAYRDLHQILQPLNDEERENIMEELRLQVGKNGTYRTSYRPMKSEEVVKMADGGLIEIGSHTVTHSLLTAHSRKVQYEELTKSKRNLENLLNRPVTLFCYPYGGIETAVSELVRDVGFEGACTTVSKPVTAGSPLFQLPRCWVGDCDGETLTNHLHEILTDG